MSIAEKISAALGGKSKPDPASPAELKRRIAEAEARIRELTERHADASLQWAAGATGSGETRDELDAQLTAARRDLRALQAALALSIEREAEAERKRVAALHAAQIRAVEQHFARRDKAASEASKALALFAEHYRSMVRYSEKARAACPVGAAWPSGGMCEVGALMDAVRHELFRIGGADERVPAKRPLPGAKAPTLSLLDNPSAVEPLADVIARASRYVLGTLKGERADHAPAPATQPNSATSASTATPLETEDVEDDPSAAMERETLATGPKTSAVGYVPQKVKLS